MNKILSLAFIFCLSGSALRLGPPVRKVHRHQCTKFTVLNFTMPDKIGDGRGWLKSSLASLRNWQKWRLHQIFSKDGRRGLLPPPVLYKNTFKDTSGKIVGPRNPRVVSPRKKKTLLDFPVNNEDPLGVFTNNQSLGSDDERRSVTPARHKFLEKEVKNSKKCFLKIRGT